MEYNCPNCNRLIVENFCGNCGQKKYKRIDRKYILDELQYSLIHTNKGFLYSLKNILKNPGKTAIGFIDGNRVNHYKPILLAFLLCGISAFISFKIIGLNELMKNYYVQQKMYSDEMNHVMSIIASYNSIIMLFLIPIFAIYTKLAFRKWGHNYYEHVIMNAYILSFYILVNIILVYPLLYIFKDNVAYLMPIVTLSMLGVPIILVWFYKGLYHDKKWQHIVLRVLLILLMVFVSYIIAVFAAIILLVIVKGPEVLKNLQPK